MHSENIYSILVTEEISKLENSNVSKEEQPENIYPISVTECVFNRFISNSVHKLQPLNIPYVVAKEVVSVFCGKNIRVNLLHPLNILAIDVSSETSNLSKSIVSI